MRTLIAFALAVAAGLALYVATFTSFVHKPMTVDQIGRYVAYKRAILEREPPPRIVVLAGSNGRFSHSCAAIRAATGVPCVNLSIHAGLGLRFQLDAYIGALRPGDLVYLPLEYRVDGFWNPKYLGDESGWLVAHDPARLPALFGPLGTVRALFQFDLRSLIGALGEMLLDRLGVERRFGIASMNAYGDEVGNDRVRSRTYAAYRAALPPLIVDRRAYADPAHWADVTSLIDRLHARGVIVVGGLPTVFDDTRGVGAAAPFLADLFAQHSACFVVLPGRSLYPRADFFDGYYHLAEEAQAAHSRALAPVLAGILRSGGCTVEGAAPR